MKNEIKLNTINFNEATEDFITYLDVNEETLRCYKEGIKKFLGYLQNIEVKYPTRNEIRAFREYLAKEHSIYTVNGYLTAIRRFFAYLEDNNIYENITKNVKSLKTSNIPVRQTLSEEECKKIYKTLSDKRERLIFSLCITTGLRANEVALAKIENIKMYNGEVVLFVKCKKRDDESEYVKLSDEVLGDLNDYLGHRTSGYIFVSTSNNNNGEGLTNTSIRNIVKAIFRRFGYDEKGFSCHSLRRTMATISYNAGADIVAIQQVLHQKSLSTTKRYIQQCTRNNNKLESEISSRVLA